MRLFTESLTVHNCNNMKQVLINGYWVTPPDNGLDKWLEEIIAVELDGYLCIKRMVPRFELIRAVRKSSRSKVIPVRIVRSM